MADDENFLKRWSKRKQAEGKTAQDTADADAAPVEDDQIASLEPQEASAPSPDEADVPAQETSDEPAPWEGVDIDSLTADSDFTVFMGEGVPTDVKTRALDKLWRSDPVFANLDGLNDYDLDYSSWGIKTEIVKTAYKVGQGFLTDEEKAKSIAESHGVEEGDISEDGAAEDAEDTQGDAIAEADDDESNISEGDDTRDQTMSEVEDMDDDGDTGMDVATSPDKDGAPPGETV